LSGPAGIVERFVEYPPIRPGSLEEREYQRKIAASAVESNTLVVLPTGLGKTAIALRVAAEFLRRYPARSILFLAPTRPLVVQHARMMAQTLDAPEPVVLTGAVTPERRQALLKPPQLIVATPQVIANDLLAQGFPITALSLVIFDEAHRAVGDYPYVALGAALRGSDVRVLAMTASPGARIERVREVWGNLGVSRFERRSASDPDVMPYTHGIQVEPVIVPLPTQVRHLGILLQTVVRRQVEALQKYGFSPGADLSRRELLEIGRILDRQIAAARSRNEPAPGPVWGARTAQAIAMKANHAVELVETQGVEALRQYLDRQAADPRARRSPALRSFLSDPDVVEVLRQLRDLDLEHPKIETALRLVEEEMQRAPTARVILFTQYRQTAEQLVGEFARRRDRGVRAVRFVGQASHGSDEGMSQKEQVEVLDRFRRGEVNCLVATSVAEEGLDIPSTDLVVLYEPVPDEIRTIQRRGRTGRARAGRAFVLIAQGTRDEGMFRAAQAKERRMHEMLERVQTEQHQPGGLAPARGRLPVQRVLAEFDGTGS
jgi:ERCC4-related helicase